MVLLDSNDSVSFGWFEFEETIFPLPYVIRRNSKKYLSYNLLKQKIFDKYDQNVRHEFEASFKWVQCTLTESNVLNEAFTNHLNLKALNRRFEPDEPLVNLEEFIHFYHLMKKKYKKRTDMQNQQSHPVHLTYQQNNYQQISQPCNQNYFVNTTPVHFQLHSTFRPDATQVNWPTYNSLANCQFYNYPPINFRSSNSTYAYPQPALSLAPVQSMATLTELAQNYRLPLEKISIETSFLDPATRDSTHVEANIYSPVTPVS